MLFGYCTFDKLQIDLSALVTPDALLGINVRGLGRLLFMIPKRPSCVKAAKVEIEVAWT